MKAVKKFNTHYYKYVYSAWTQPTLTSNGSMGGSDFAVSGTVTNGSYQPYMVFNDNLSTADAWIAQTSQPEFIFYNPVLLKVTNIQVTNPSFASTYAVTGGTIFGSNDNSSWTTIKSFTNSNTTNNATWNIDLSDNTSVYNYYKISITSHANDWGGFAKLVITATQRTTVESTSSDYDYYVDTTDFYMPIELTRGYYKLIQEYTTTGDSSLTLTQGTYLVEAVSAGSGGTHIDHLNSQHSYYVGATGGYYKGLITIPANTYTVSIGAGGWSGSTNSYVIYSGGKTSIGNVFELSGGSDSSGGTLVSADVVKTLEYNIGYPLQYKGTATDWYPVYGTQTAPVPTSLQGYGFGGAPGTQGVAGTNGGNGYLKITQYWEEEPASYDYYVDTNKYYAVSF